VAWTIGAFGCGGIDDADLSPRRMSAVVVPSRCCCSSIHDRAATAPGIEISIVWGAL
jgi:hypothetical protein